MCNARNVTRRRKIVKNIKKHRWIHMLLALLIAILLALSMMIGMAYAEPGTNELQYGHVQDGPDEFQGKTPEDTKDSVTPPSQRQNKMPQRVSGHNRALMTVEEINTMAWVILILGLSMGLIFVIGRYTREKGKNVDKKRKL